MIAQGIADVLYDGEIAADQTTVVSGGFGIARATRRYLKALRPGQILNGAYQYGAIGPDVGYTVGAAAAVQAGAGVQSAHQGAPVVAITGDAGFAYSGMEIETLAKYQLPVVLVVYNNNAWGVWGSGRRSARSQHMYLFQENLRYEKVAEALGVLAFGLARKGSRLAKSGHSVLAAVTVQVLLGIGVWLLILGPGKEWMAAPEGRFLLEAVLATSHLLIGALVTATATALAIEAAWETREVAA